MMLRAITAALSPSHGPIHRVVKFFGPGRQGSQKGNLQGQHRCRLGIGGSGEPDHPGQRLVVRPQALFQIIRSRAVGSPAPRRTPLHELGTRVDAADELARSPTPDVQRQGRLPRDIPPAPQAGPVPLLDYCPGSRRTTAALAAGSSRSAGSQRPPSPTPPPRLGRPRR